MGLRDGSNAGPTGQHLPGHRLDLMSTPRRWQVPVETLCPASGSPARSLSPEPEACHLSHVALSGCSLGVDGLKQNVLWRRAELRMASQQQSPVNTPEGSERKDVGLTPREDFHRGLGLAISMRAQSRGGGRRGRVPSGAGGPMPAPTVTLPWAPEDSLAQKDPGVQPPRQRIGPEERSPPHRSRGGAAASKAGSPKEEPTGCAASLRPGPRPAANKQPWGEPWWIYGPSLPSLPSRLLLSNG